MPVRQNVRRVDTPEIQKPDGWVEVYKINAETALGLMAMSAELRDTEGTNADLVREIAGTALAQVKAWNWVNSDGEPFPMPAEIEEPLKALTLEEIMVLVNALTGRDEAQGNSESESPPTSD